MTTPNDPKPASSTPEARSSSRPGVPRPDANAPRPVTVTSAAAAAGRLPVTVVVVPVARFESDGLFVDFQKGTKAVALADADVLDDRPVTLAAGDAAIAALSAREAAGKPAATTSGAPATGRPIRLADSPAPSNSQAQAGPTHDAGLVSHQIAKACVLTVGQAETYRAEVSLPVAPDGEAQWYYRARFATTKSGDDLSSVWLPV